MANYYAGTVSILPGNGAGNFGTAMSYNMRGAASTVVGDFNADGKPDLAVSSDNLNFGKVSILFNSCNAVPSPSPTPDPGPTYSISGHVANDAAHQTFIKLSGTQGGISGINTSTGEYIFSGLPSGGT